MTELEPNDDKTTSGQDSRRLGENILTAYLDGVEEGIWLCDADDRTTYVNERMADALGYKREELLGQPILQYVVPEEREDQVLRCRKRRSGIRETFVRHLLTRDGSRRAFLVTSTATRDSQGRYVGSAAVFVDISDTESVLSTLQQQSVLLASIFATAPVGIAIVRKRRFVDVNDFLCRMSGYSREELLGKSVRIFYESDDEYERVGREVYTRLMPGNSLVVQTTLVSRVGRRIPVLLTLAHLNPDNPHAGITVVAQDLSYLLRHIEASEQRRHMARALLEAIPDVGFILDEQQRIVEVNPAAARLLGVPEKDLVGRRCYEVVHLMSEPPPNCPFVCLEETAGVPRRMYEPRLGGWFDVSVTPIPRSGSGPQLYIHIARDVNELVEDNARLVRHTSWLRGLVELSTRSCASEQELLSYALDTCVEFSGSRIGFAHICDEGVVNLEMFVWSRGVLEECCEPRDRIYPISEAGIWADALRQRRPVIVNDYEHAPGRRGLPEGHPKLVRCLVTPIIEGDRVVMLVGVGNKELPYTEEDASQITAYFGTVWQILCRHRAEAELRATNVSLEQRVIEKTAQLVKSNERLRQFASKVSHDVNKPLTHARMFLSSVDSEAGKLSPSAQEDLKSVADALERAQVMCRGLLKLARHTAGMIQRQNVDLGQMATRYINELRRAEPERTVELIIRGDVTAYCDASLSERTLENLIDNAWKFSRTRNPAVIEVGSCDRHGRRWFYVRDNGVGFDAAHAQDLFMPFQRYHVSDSFEGTGIGLSTAAVIVWDHDGAIEVESEPDHGATFYFHFGDDAPRP